MRAERGISLIAGVVAFVALAASAPAKPAAPRNARELWAYPSAVIVTSEVSGLKRLAGGLQAEELQAMVRAAEPGVAACLAHRRELADSPTPPGSRVRITLTARFLPTGELAQLVPEHQPTAGLVECTARAMVAIVAHGARVTPLKTAKPLTVRLKIDGVILTDEEAKGRGFLYYEERLRQESRNKTDTK